MDDFLVFGSPQIGQAEIDEVVDSLESGWLGTGPKVARFENAFKDYMGTAHAVALNSCTAALHLSILALDLDPGDEVITSPMTFCATVNAIIHAGAAPVMADVDPTTMNIDPGRIAERITPRTRAVLPVHFGGLPCDMSAITGIAQAHSLGIVEDCAHAIETKYRGVKAGTFGDFGCFSFYVTKNVVTGEGGMVITACEERAARIKVLALHGMTKDAWRRFGDEGYKHYQVVECGFKYNMMDLQAAIGLHQLERVEANWMRRSEIWHEYAERLSDLPVRLPADAEPGDRHAYHLFPIMLDPEECPVGRDAFLDAMIERGIGVGVHYVSIPEHSYYREAFGWRPEDYPVAMRIGRTTVSLPLSAKLKEQDVDRVVRAVQEIIGV